MKQYYHISKASTDALLKHWTERQTSGKVPLKFKKVAKVIRERKRTSGEDSDSDSESSKEASEESRSDDDDRSDEGAEDGRRRSNSAGQQRLPNDEVRNLDVFLGLEV